MFYSQLIACIFLLLFTIVATVDGIYFHLYKYRLFARKESIKEHYLHTINSFLFPITVFLLFVINSAGFMLWFVLFLTIATLIIEFIDVFEEKSSRENLGGLTSLEYSMHFAMSGIRATYTTIILAQKPFLAWSLQNSWIAVYQENLLFTRIIGLCVAFLGIPIFILHYYLGKKYERQ